MSDPYAIVAVLFVNAGEEATFEVFEGVAAAIMREYGGRIANVIRCADSGKGAEAPYEVHVIEFPSESTFLEYRRDPRLLARSDERARAICRTDLWVGRAMGPPGSAQYKPQ